MIPCPACISGAINYSCQLCQGSGEIPLQTEVYVEPETIADDVLNAHRRLIVDDIEGV